MLEGCVRHLTVSGGAKTSGLTRKKKKAKILEGLDTAEENISLGNWQLRVLILSSLHKLFLHDTGNPKFLDSTNFEASICASLWKFIHLMLIKETQLIACISFICHVDLSTLIFLTDKCCLAGFTSVSTFFHSSVTPFF